MNEEKQNRNNLREGQGNQNNYQRESCVSNGSSPHREKRYSGESMKQSNSNRGNPWNCLRGMSRQQKKLIIEKFFLEIIGEIRFVRRNIENLIN